MTLAGWLLVSLGAFAVAYAVYSRIVARLFGLNAATKTPAHEHHDGANFVPTPRFYLLSQHFSAISAAGPIAGPILAALAFGWKPAILWIVLGCIFIGALHDFSALVGSMRHGACSVAELMRKYLNGRTWAAFSFYIWLALVYVIIAFTDITARAFVEDLDVTVPGSGERLLIRGAGVAASSMLYLFLGVAMGLFVKIFKPRLWTTTLIFVPLVAAAVALGPMLPLHWVADGPIPSLYWSYAILLYCGVASMLPVWLLLQPRGYLGGFFLYVTLLGGVLGLVLENPAAEWPGYLGFTSAQGQPLVPFLFITIACGACSGFHGLVCSGTTSKQIDREPDARVVGYGGMLLEGVVALLALACVMWLAADSPVAKQNPDKIFGYGVGTFLSRLGVPLTFAVSFGMLAFATFVYDTLDVCTRLGRYLFQEFTGLRGRAGALAGTVVTLALPLVAVSQTATDAGGRIIPAYKVIWPLFGTSNQLLAALTLLGLLLWLVRTNKPRILRFIVGIPMIFMSGITLSALVLQIKDAKATNLLLTVAVTLLVLSLWILAEALLALLIRRQTAPLRAQ